VIYRKTAILGLLGLLLASAGPALAQKKDPKQRPNVRTVTIPISIYRKKESKQDQTEELIQIDRLIVREDKDNQTILSIRSVMNTPLSLAVVLQEDLSQGVNLQLGDLRDFIKGLPRGSRVMVGYIRGGTFRVRQRFTDNLERAAASLQIVGGNASSNGPFEGIAEATSYFEAMPSGRRAILLVSDGVDASQGTTAFDLLNSPQLDQATLKAQRRGVAVYSIYSPTQLTQSANSTVISYGQGALQKLADETGGQSFYQGTVAPVSYIPFLRDLDMLLDRQFALTFLSTHMKKGYHRVDVTSTNPDVKIEHPQGYYYR
jgi:hypothetical protein